MRWGDFRTPDRLKEEVLAFPAEVFGDPQAVNDPLRLLARSVRDTKQTA
jgi:hypothetical protein